LQETKICVKCNKEKYLSEFYWRKDTKTYRNECKECFNSQCKLYTLNNKEKIRQRKKYYYYNNINKVKIYAKQYYKNNKDEIIQKAQTWQKDNKDKYNIRYRSWSKQNTEKRRISNLNWRNKNRNKFNLWCRSYRNNNINVKINYAISNGIWKTLKGKKNKNKWELLVGYTLQDLMQHLESKFTDGMTWNNYGYKGWHIDHVIPKTHFEFNSYEDREFQQCWSLANLQPLWAEENLKKGDRYYG
jgi:hypothetical protein